MKPVDIYRRFHPIVIEFMFFSSEHWRFSRNLELELIRLQKKLVSKGSITKQEVKEGNFIEWCWYSCLCERKMLNPSHFTFQQDKYWVFCVIFVGYPSPRRPVHVFTSALNTHPWLSKAISLLLSVSGDPPLTYFHSRTGLAFIVNVYLLSTLPC